MGLVLVFAFEDQRLHLEWHALRAYCLDDANWPQWIQSGTCAQQFGQMMEDLVVRPPVRASRVEIGGFAMTMTVLMSPLVERRPPHLVALRGGGAVLQLQRELRLVSALDWEN